MTRKPESDAAQALAKMGIEIVQGDLDDPRSLRKALAGGFKTTKLSAWAALRG